MTTDVQPAKSYLVFYGSECALIGAATEDDAYAHLCHTFGQRGLFRPERHEVTIREPREADIAWMADSEMPAFVACANRLRAQTRT